MFKVQRKDGYVLMGALSMSVLMLVVGSASMYMISMGSQTVGSERQYEITKNAADYGLQKAIEAVTKSTDANPCTIASKTDLLPGKDAGYSYFTKSDEDGNNCLVYSEGLDKVSYDNKVAGKSISGSRVVKTAIIPTKKPDGSGLGAMNTGSMSNINWNGSEVVVGSDCGPGLTYSQLGPNTSLISNDSNRLSGNPKTLQSTQNLYESTFNSPVNSWDTLKTEIDNSVSSKMKDVSNACKVSDLNTNCDTNKVKGNLVIECTGGTPKTIDPSACSEIVLSIQTMSIDLDIPSTTKMTVNTSNTLEITKSVSGLLTSDNTLNIDLKGNEVLDGIFIGGSGGNNMTLGQAGNPQISGLIFMGNKGSYNIVASGNTKLSGSLIVDGTINNFTKNGNGANPPNFEYNEDSINEWQTKYPTLIKPATCDSGTPPSKKAMLENTKMSLF